MQPTVSVIIKSYNHERFVGEAIQSILDQSFTDFELLITDDASNDGTPNVIATFSDARIEFERFSENRGISGVMNSLISRARGRYIAILNSDDFALPRRLEKQVAFLEANNETVALFSIARTVDDFGEPSPSYYDFRVPFTLPDFSRDSWRRFFFFYCNCLCAPTAMIRRSAYVEAGPYDERLTNLQDLDMWIRLTAHGDINVLNEELTAFRVRSGSANASAPRRDTALRSQWEYSRILRHYRHIDRVTLLRTFAADFAAHGIASDVSIDRLLAELACTVSDSPAHRLFAIETMFEGARSRQDYKRLRELTGTTDLFGLQ